MKTLIFVPLLVLWFVSATAVGLFSQQAAIGPAINSSDTLKLQTQCEKHALKASRKVEGNGSNFHAIWHYNAKLNICFLETQKGAILNGSALIFKDFIDVDGGLSYGYYVFKSDSADNPYVCRMGPELPNPKRCTSEKEFDDFVANYMEDRSLSIGQNPSSDPYTTGIWFNGRVWMEMEQKDRMDYLMGFYDGMVDMSLHFKTDPKIEGEIFLPNHPTYQAEILEINKFYEDGSNIIIPIVYARHWVIRKMRGATPSELQELLVEYRSTSNNTLSKPGVTEGNKER